MNGVSLLLLVLFGGLLFAPSTLEESAREEMGFDHLDMKHEREQQPHQQNGLQHAARGDPHRSQQNQRVPHEANEAEVHPIELVADVEVEVAAIQRAAHRLQPVGGDVQVKANHHAAARVSPNKACCAHEPQNVMKHRVCVESPHPELLSQFECECTGYNCHRACLQCRQGKQIIALK